MESRKAYQHLFKSVVVPLFFILLISCFHLTQAICAIGQMGITGVVYDAGTLQGVSGAIVRVRSTGFSESVPTDISGSYSVSGCPTDHEITISCRKAGFAPYTVVIPSISSETTIANYVHNIYLRTLAEGAPSYDEDDADIIYIYDGDSQDTSEREYTPGVDPGDVSP